MFIEAIKMNPIIPALVGTIVGGFISWGTNTTQKKSQTTFNFHREFDSHLMHESRIKADIFIKLNPNLTLNEMTETYSQDSFHIWQVIKFYRRLWVAIKYKQVILKLVPDLFGETFMGWYIKYFHEKYIQNPVYRYSQGCEDILNLKKWFDNHSKKSEMYKWKEFVSKEFELNSKFKLIPKSSNKLN